MKSWLIGGGADCDVVVDLPTVSAHHCRLTRDEQGYWLEDLRSTNGTFVNGQRICAATRVSQEDCITLGTSVRVPWPDTPITEESRIVTIGGAADNSIVLDYPMVSAHHARLILTGTKAVLEDIGSKNGTFLGSPPSRISRAELHANDSVSFGSYQIPASQLLTMVPLAATHSPAEAEPRPVRRRAQDEFLIGRDPTSDEVLDDVMVSRRHAVFRRVGNRCSIEDLHSTNGTYVNGQRIDSVVALTVADIITVGSTSFTLTEAGALQKRQVKGRIAIEARNLGVAVPQRQLLHDVSLTIYPSEFVGLMGPSGAGKSTLISALNGYMRPSSGVVFFNGMDLYGNYDLFRGQIGYVPQDDIVHRELSVYQALYYNARLRLPADYSDEEIHRRIGVVLEQLGLQGTEDVRIGSAETRGISGGQRKRVNLALELLTDPSALFLDEPTSGLSSEDTLQVMRLLRQLANSGKTILLTIHQPSLEAFRQLDNLILIAKDAGTTDPAHLAYYGPAYPDAIRYFQAGMPESTTVPATDTPDVVLRSLATRPAADWVSRYNRSETKRHFVTDREGQSPENATASSAYRPSVSGSMRQWWTLVRRGAAIKRKDTWNTAILIAQAPIIAVLIALVFGKQSRGPSDTVTWPEAAQATAISVFLLALSALWFGCSNSAREIVAEWAVYRRERMVNLAISCYAASKLTLLGLICAFQCAVLLTVVHFWNGLEISWLAAYFVLLLVALVGVGIGLVISSFARSSEAAIATLPIVIIPMVILGGILHPVHEMHWLPRALCQAMPSRWAFEALLTLEADNRPQRPPSKAVAAVPSQDASRPTEAAQDFAEHYFPQQTHRVGAWASALVLGVMGVLLVGALVNILWWRDIH